MFMRFYAICIFVMMSFMANAATCPNGYSELSVNENDKIVPMDERCPDGTTEVYTVSDCSGANAGSVCAVCDGGALTSGGTCATLCSVGAKKINFGKNLSFDLLSDRTTKPSLNISMGRGKVCYVGLESGADKGLNFKLPGNRIYHATNASSGGYRVCRAGHTLSYVCNGNTVEKQVLLDGGWYTLPSAGVCSAPDGRRFGGWYMDGVKQEPYKINVYNYGTDKQMIARFLEKSDYYSINYYCSVNGSSPVYVDKAEFDVETSLKNVCQNYRDYHIQIAWFTRVQPEYITRLNTWCLENVADTGLCAEAMVNFRETLESGYEEGDFGAFYFGQGDNVLPDNLWSVLIFSYVLATGEQALNGGLDVSAITDIEKLSEVLLGVLYYEHTWLDPVLWEGVGDTGQQKVNVGKDIDLYALYVPGEAVTYDCGDYGERINTLYGDHELPVYGEGYDFSGECRHNLYPNVNYNGGLLEYGCGYTGDYIDDDYYEAKYGDDLIWIYEGPKTAVGVYDCKFKAEFDCGVDGVLKNPDDAIVMAEYLRVDGNQRFELDVVAECVPKEGKEFDGWAHNSSYSTDSLYYSVGDAVDWADLDFYEGAYFEAVYKDVE